MNTNIVIVNCSNFLPNKSKIIPIIINTIDDTYFISSIFAHIDAKFIDGHA